MAEPTETIDGEVLAEFGGELRRFRLTVPDLAKVQRDCGAGPGVISQELARAVQVLEYRAEKGLAAVATIAAGLGDWKVEYITRTLFHGLVRGGATPNEAARLVRENVDERGFMGLVENANLAFCVMTGAYFGPKDDPVGESAGAAGTAPKTTRKSRSRTAKSASRGSTA